MGIQVIRIGCLSKEFARSGMQPGTMIGTEGGLCPTVGKLRLHTIIKSLISSQSKKGVGPKNYFFLFKLISKASVKETDHAF